MDTLKTLGFAYRRRLADTLVQEYLAAAGAVLIEGPRACGKTMTAMNAAASFALFDDPATFELTQIAPDKVLEGAKPKLLDEWQIAPTMWNLVRRKVDMTPGKGLFILTGSAVPADDTTRHTGAGRILRLRQRTLTWFEKLGAGELEGVTLAGLFDGKVPSADLSSPMTYSGVVRELVRPGFPALTDLQPKQAFRLLRDFIDEVARADLPRLVDLRHDPTVIGRLIVALARSVASDVSFATLAKDLRNLAPSIRPQTVASYVAALERLFVVEPQGAWTPRLRSRARLRRAAKFHLADPALAAAALGVDAAGLEEDPQTVGLLFESAVIHDLRVLADLIDGEVRHFRDSNGYEIDAVVTLPNGRWGAVEVKLGSGQIGEGARSLARAVEQLGPEAKTKLAFRLVISGTGPTLVMDDGTVTCPLAALRP